MTDFGTRSDETDGARAARAEPGLADAVGALAAALRHDQVEADRVARRHRRRAFWWRLLSILLIVGLVFAFAFGRSEGSGPHVARVSVQGMILSDLKRDALMDTLAASDAVKGVILHIDSPGGTTVGGEALYASIRKVAEKKPVVAVMGEVAASAAFLAAIGADHVVARGNTITASVGVIYTAPNVSGLLDSLGVSVTEVATGANKAKPSFYGPVTEDALEDERALIADSFAWFIDLVRERRDASAETIAFLSDGRILSGRKARELGLVDAIGGEEAARDWLAESRGVDRGIAVRDREPGEPEKGTLSTLVDGLFGGSSALQSVDMLLKGALWSSLRHNS